MSSKAKSRNPSPPVSTSETPRCQPRPELLSLTSTSPLKKEIEISARSYSKMIVRSLWRCTGNAAPRLRFLQAKPRRFSSSAAATPSPPPSQTAMLATFTNDFDRIAPRFEVNGSQIQVLRSPAEFYESLKVYLAASTGGRRWRLILGRTKY